MLKHPILSPPWSEVGGPLRKTKRREAGKSARGRRRRGQLSCSVQKSHPGGIWGTCGPLPPGTGDASCQESWQPRARSVPRGNCWQLSRRQNLKLQPGVGSGAGPGGPWEAGRGGLCATCPPGSLGTVAPPGLQQGADPHPCRTLAPQSLPGTSAVERALDSGSTLPLTHHGIQTCHFFLGLSFHVVPNTVLLTAASQ